MIGLMILIVIIAYVLLAKFIITKTYEKFATKKAKYIATAIMILIPTWDIIIGYPIYKYLCFTKAGVHVYKTVDNVEGFYIGEKRHSSLPYEPYKGYKYVDYREKESEKYYRSYWIESNTSELCVLPRRKFSDYAKAFKQGRCVAKEEIAEGEVSQWEFIHYKIGSEKNIPIFNINNITSFKFIDRRSKIILGELIEYSWIGGWVNQLKAHVYRSSGYGCSGSDKLKYEDIYIKILKPKGKK